MKDAFKVGDKVWVAYPRQRRKPDDLTGMRKGRVCYIGDRYITLWVEANANPKQGWKECFMFQEIISGKINVLPRDKLRPIQARTFTYDIQPLTSV